MRIRLFITNMIFSAFILCGLPFVSAYAADNSPDISLQINEGRDKFNQGKYEQALTAWNIALKSYKLSGNKEGEAHIQLYKSDAYLAIGQNYKAVNSLKLALKLAESAGNRQLENRIAGSLGTAYMLSSKAKEARQLLEKTIKKEQEDGRHTLAAVAGNNLGNLLALNNNHDASYAAYKQAIIDAETAGNDNLIAKGMVNIARLMIEKNENKKIIEHLNKTFIHTKTLSDSHEKAYILISLGRLYTQYMRNNDVASEDIDNLAFNTFKLSIQVGEKIKDNRALSYAYGYMGSLSEQKNQVNDAMNYTHLALKYLQQTQAPEIKYRWQWQLGRLLKTQNNIEQAIQSYQHAVGNLQKVRHVLASDKIKNKGDFRSKSGKVYMELADLLLKSSANKTKKETESNLRQVRSIVEMLKTAELENYFHDDCVAALKKKIKGIDNLGKQTAAIYPIIFPERLEILLSLPDGMKRYTVAVSEDELNNEINRFRTKLEKRTTHQYKRHAMKIYSWLIQPLIKDLESQAVETLIFIPDGSLRTIPITALYDGKNFLISKYAVATTPNLTLTHPQPLPRDNLKILIAGLTDSVQGFPPLPNVDTEVKKINNLYDSSLLENTNFTQTQFEQTLNKEPYSIIHIASHGKFKSDVRSTFLLTYDSKINMDTLETYMAGTKYRDKPVELLTLSACQTAVGDDKAALGLGGIAVKAGARSALATLWYINDQASSLIIKDFYKNLKDARLSKAKSLQLAQINLIKDRRFKHPSYWAPFLLIGNWL